MAVVDVINTKAEKVSEVALSDTVFNVPVKASVMHGIVTMQLANRRAGSASVKHRSDVRGSTRKLYRQKGTGRARRGNIKSPLLRGGGSTFGPDPKIYNVKVPKKVRRLGLKMALSSKYQEQRLTVVDKIELERIKTRDIFEILGGLEMQDVLIITAERDEKLERSTRNIPNVKVLRTEGLNVYDILKHRHLLLLEPSVKAIEGRLEA